MAVVTYAESYFSILFCYNELSQVIHFLQKYAVKIIISLYSINRLGFVKEVEYVFCMVQTKL
jgi:hypothetical protein